MKLLKIIVLFASVFILCEHNASAQTLKFIAERNVESMNFKRANQIKVLLSKGKSLGTYLAIPLIEEIDAILNQNSIKPGVAKVLISTVSDAGTTNYYTYSDFDNNVAMLPVYLISQEKVGARLYDTVYYQDEGDASTVNMDLSGLDRQAFGATIISVRLQFNTITEALKKEIFGGFGLLFPVDKSPNRWAGNIKSIRVFVIE